MLCYLFPAPFLFFFAPDLPELLYYSHLPAIVVALLIGMFVYVNDPKSLLNKLLLIICSSFSLWTLLSLVTWTYIHVDFLLFIWTFFGILYSFISIFSIYFIYVFINKRDVGLRIKTVFLALLAPVLLLAPTAYNVSGFNLAACDAFGFEGLPYLAYHISLGVIAMVWIFFLLAWKYRTAARDFRKQIILIGIGIEFFLFSFFSTGFLASYLAGIGFFPDSRLEMYGFFSMIVFMALIAYMIVRFRAFNIGLIAPQALVVALLVLIGAQFTFITSPLNLILNGIAIVLTGVVGLILIRSVEREIRQRQMIEKQEKELEEINKRQETLLHFVSHEVKGYLTKNMTMLAGLVEGDFGPVSDDIKALSARALAETRNGSKAVMDILLASNQKKGTMTYQKEPFDLLEFAKAEAEKARPHAEEKGLAFSFSAPDGAYSVNGDKNQLAEHAIRNLIENAIHYTEKGSIAVSVDKSATGIRFMVQDTGIGISEEDKKRLFTEGGKGKESTRHNVHSTGYGLFIARSVVEGHGGKIWAESDGPGKGSRFIFELPV